MHGRRTETRYHTDEQVETALLKALEMLDGNDVSSDDRAAALPKLLELLTAKNIEIEQVVPGNGLLGIPRG